MEKLSKCCMMLLVVALCVGTSSCSESGETDNGNGETANSAFINPLVNEGKLLLTRIEGDDDETSFGVTYDNQHRPVSIQYYDGYGISIDYNTSTIINDEDSDNVSFTREGYLKSLLSNWAEDGEYSTFSLSFSYDSGGHLSKYVDNEKWNYDGYYGTYSTQVTYVWENGNIVKSIEYGTYTESGYTEEETLVCTIEYSDVDNTYRQYTPGFSNVITAYDDFDLNPVGLAGIGPKKLPRRIITTDGDTYTFKYELNPDGSIHEETVVCDESSGYTFTEAYRFYYTPI